MGHKCEVGFRLMGINYANGKYIFNITKQKPTISLINFLFRSMKTVSL